MKDTRSHTLVPDQWVTNYADLLYRYVYFRLADTLMSEDLVQETFLSAWKSRDTYNQSSSEKNWLFTICKNKLVDHYRRLKSPSFIPAVVNAGNEDYSGMNGYPTNSDQSAISKYPGETSKLDQSVDNNHDHSIVVDDNHDHSIVKNSLPRSITYVAKRYYFDEEDHWTTRAGPVSWQISELPIHKQDFFNVLSRCRSKLNKQQQTAFSLRYLDEIEAKEICRLMGITVQNYWILIHRAKLQLRECLQRNWIDV